MSCLFLFEIFQLSFFLDLNEKDFNVVASKQYILKDSDHVVHIMNKKKYVD